MYPIFIVVCVLFAIAVAVIIMMSVEIKKIQSMITTLCDLELRDRKRINAAEEGIGRLELSTRIYLNNSSNASISIKDALILFLEDRDLKLKYNPPEFAIEEK